MITLSSELPAISDPAGLTIDGTGQSVAGSGDSSFRVMEVSNGAELDLVSVALIKGFAGPEGPYEGTGGGIKIGSYATVTISNSTIADNTSSGWGGGIINNGSLTISNTTISGNVANTEDGGGIFNYIGTEWQDITIQPVDTANNIIGGNTSTLSPFLMAIPDAVPPASVGGVAGLVAGNETVPDESSPTDVTGVAPAMALAGVVLALIGGTTLYVRRRHVRM